MGYGIMMDKQFLQHRSRYDHPECPERLVSIMSHLEKIGILDGCEEVPARRAAVDELALVHEESYVHQTIHSISDGWGQLDPDTFYSPGTLDAALLAAGGTTDLAKRIYRNELDFGFALNRPPGHHAMPKRAMGFCIFNHMAIAAKSLLQEGAKRILIFDWDVHHGNGTQSAFYDDPRVLFISVHQWPHFPGTGLVDEIGIGDGRGYSVNLPLSGGAKDRDYLAIMSQIVGPLAELYQPEAVLVSAGFDAHERDLLGGMQLTDEGFAEMARRIRAIAEPTGRGACFVLEGGYDLEGLSSAVGRVVNVVDSGEPGRLDGIPSNSCQTVIDATKSAIASYWENL